MSTLCMFAEIFLQNRKAFITQNTLRYLWLPERVVKYHLRTAIAFFTENPFQFDIAGAIHKPSQFHPYHCTAEHEARFAAGIELSLIHI